MSDIFNNLNRFCVEREEDRAMGLRYDPYRGIITCNSDDHIMLYLYI